MISLLESTFHHLISSLEITTHRFLYSDFNLNNRLTGLIGPRGVGKTTLLLQYIQQHLYTEKKSFYFTADNVYFNQTTLFEFVAELYHTHGICYIFIDEIHKYKNWSQELKNIYDSFPKIKVVFSGSSSLDLTKGGYDLSRRAKLYYLPGLSFREYLYLETQHLLPVIPIENLLSHPTHYNATLSIHPQILGHFKKYLLYYYPFAMENKSSYFEKIIRIIEKTIYEDIAEYYNMKTENLHYLKKILGFLASIPPGEVNVNNIAKNLGIDHKTTFNYLSMLQETNLIRMLYSQKNGNAILRKPEKIFLNNTSLLYALNSMRGSEPPIGNMRELFLLQTISDAKQFIFYSDEGDFYLNDRIIEVGGKNKTSQQLKNSKHSTLLVKDDITAATPNIIPLFYFGFLY